MFGLKRMMADYMEQQKIVIEEIRTELADIKEAVSCHENSNSKSLYENITRLNNMLNEFKGMVAMERAQYKRMVEECKEKPGKKKKKANSIEADNFEDL